MSPNASAVRPHAVRRTALLFALAFFAPLVPGLAHAIPENQPGYVEHRMWTDRLYRSQVNLLNENTSFEVGDASTGALDGGYFMSTIWQANLADPSDITTLHQGFSFDSNFAVHGSRSLRIDFPVQTYKRDTAGFLLSWEWFTVPRGAGGNYEITFYAKGYRTGSTGPNMPVNVDLTRLNRLEGREEAVCVYERPPSDPPYPCEANNSHAELSVPCPYDMGAPFRRYVAYTQEPLVEGESYSLQIWMGGAPQWTATPGTTLWLDAVQVAAFNPLAGAKPFSCHTSGEEIFLSMSTRGARDARRDNIYLPEDASLINGDVEIYAPVPRAGGRLDWSLYSVGGPGLPLGSGSIPAGSARTARQHFRVPLGPAVAGRFGVYKWIVEYFDSIGRRVERQETSFAVVRAVPPLPAGAGGNFGLYLDATNGAWNSYRNEHDVEVQGRYSVQEAFSYARKLGFTRERVFRTFNEESNCRPGPHGCADHFGFYADEAYRQGVRLSPVINTMAAGSTLDDWESWIGMLADLYGADGAQPGMFEWNIDNEANMPHERSCAGYIGSGVIEDEAARILRAARALGPDDNLVTTVNDGLCLGGDSRSENFLLALLTTPATDGPAEVRGVLDGVTVNSYPHFDQARQAYQGPEEVDAASPWGVYRSIETLRKVKQAVQDASAPNVRLFSLSETGLDPGWVQSDRLAIIEARVTAESMSGNLGAILDATNKLIRHQLIWLSEGATPIYHFVGVAPSMAAWAPVYGLMQKDGMPAGTTAAQVQLNAELGSAVVVRKIPAGDLATPSGLPPSASTNVVLFQDGADYVLVGWTNGPLQTVRFNGAFSRCTITRRDLCGNSSNIAGGVRFDANFTASPSYIRIHGYTGDVAALVEGLDVRDPAAPSWHASLAEDGGVIVADVAFLDPGDAKEVQLKYRTPGTGAWLTAGRQEIQADPRRSYLFRFEPSPKPAVPTSYEIMAVAMEKTTNDAGAPLLATFRFVPGRSSTADVPESPLWVDGVTGTGANPSRTGAMFRGTVAQPGTLHLQVFDVLGRRVSFIDQPVAAAGTFEVSWDGRNDGGTRVASGIYLTRLFRDGLELAQRRVVFMR